MHQYGFMTVANNIFEDALSPYHEILAYQTVHAGSYSLRNIRISFNIRILQHLE